MRLSRHQMYTRIFSALNLPLEGKILGVSGLKYFKGSPHYTPPKKIISDDAEITEANYPEINMCALPFPNESFDFVIADQVLEHIEGDVSQAIAETHRVLRKGGTAIITTVFIYPTHWGPKDLWRFSPDALRYLCRHFSQVIQCEGWGNRWAIIISFLYKRAGDWEVPKHRLSIIKWLATTNDPKYPWATWIIVKK